MKNIRQSIHSCVLAVTLPTGLSIARSASIETIPGIPGDPPNAGVQDISADGSVIAGNSDTWGGFTGSQAMRWTRETGSVGLGELPGGIRQSQGYGISPDGRYIVGRSSSTLGYEAFFWSEPTAMIGIGLWPGTAQTIGWDVSNTGRVIGFGTNSSTITRAFTWTKESGMVSLGHLPGQTEDEFSRAFAVSADGNVVAGQSGEYAFRWTPDTGMVALDDLPGGEVLNSAWGISDNGLWTVGQSYSATAAAATLWDADGKLSVLGTLPGETGARATGVTDDGRVVIGQGLSTNSPFIWTSEWGVRSGYDVLEDYGLDLLGLGWYNLGFDKISMDGRYISGSAWDPNGTPTGIRIYLPIPAPSTLAPLLTLTLLTTRRR